MARAADPDLLARLAQHDPREATAALLETLLPGEAALIDAPDLMAQALSGDDTPGIEAWARDQGVARETAFRWFRDCYGVAPSRFRVEAPARRAWREIVTGPAPLAQIAADAGFSDQAHMSRDIKALTGRSPGHWRRHAARLQHRFKTGARPRGWDKVGMTDTALPSPRRPFLELTGFRFHPWSTLWPIALAAVLMQGILVPTREAARWIYKSNHRPLPPPGLGVRHDGHACSRRPWAWSASL